MLPIGLLHRVSLSRNQYGYWPELGMALEQLVVCNLLLDAMVNHVFPCVDASETSRSNLYLVLAGIAQHAFQRIPLSAMPVGGPIHL